MMVMKMHDGSWHAVWQGATLLGEFDGARQEAIDWAPQPVAECWVYAEELGEVVPLSPRRSAQMLGPPPPTGSPGSRTTGAPGWSSSRCSC